MARPISRKFARFAASSLLAAQAAVAMTVVTEIAMTTPSITTTRRATAQTPIGDARSIFEKASPAVVLIETEDASGSGSIISSDGLILTNAHVVEGSQTVRVTLKDGRKLDGQVVSRGKPGCLDLALVKVQASGKFPAIQFAPAKSLQVGEAVFAIGNPVDTTFTFTQGIVSNVGGLWILTNTVLNPGNSGGPLLDAQGRLLGVNTAKYHKTDGLYLAVAPAQTQAFVQAYQQGLSPAIGQYLIPVSQPAGKPLAQKLVLNSVQQGRLQREGNLFCADRSPANLYTFKGEADQPIMIEMMSSEMGSYLLVLGPNGELIASDIGKERDQSATVRAKLPQQGIYTVIANPAKPDQLGNYRLETSSLLLMEQSMITLSDSIDKHGHYRNYTFSGKAGQSIAIALHQFEFDPYLTLVDPSGNTVNEGKTKRQGMLEAKLPKDGIYTLRVSTLKPSDRGRFVISVQAQSNNTQSDRVSQNR